MKIRRVGLDIIRCLAIWMIVTFHFCGTVGMTDSPFFQYKNGDWGCVGTTIFFVLSGFLMQYCYSDIGSIRKFYKKRALSIFPLQIVCFLGAYIVRSIITKDFFYGGEFWKIIFSLLGIDGYLRFYSIQTYFLIGEWFTAIIILLYILYPLLNRLFSKCFILSTLVLTLLYFGNMKIGFQNVVADISVFTGTYLFWIGMLLQKYVVQIVKNKWLVLVTIVGVGFLLFGDFPFYRLFGMNILGILIFIILVHFLWKIDGEKRYAKGIIFISEISFAIYLCHHVILNFLARIIIPYLTSVGKIFNIYVLYILITIFVAIMLYYVTNAIVKMIQMFFERKYNKY